MAGLNLKLVLKDMALKQVELGAWLKMSESSVAQLVNHGIWPKRTARAVLKQGVHSYLVQHGASPEMLEAAFVDWVMPCASLEKKPAPDRTDNEGEDGMLLRKQVLTPAARKAFGLVRDPFAEVESSDDVFVSPDIRYVREALYQTARHGGFMAVVGESGAGKSTLRRDLLERIQRDGHSTVVIEPYVIGLEENDVAGKSLKAVHIAEAIMAQIAPRELLRRSSEVRFRQLHNALRESHRAGNSHLLMIEEAHVLPMATLKHLKRFFELEDGFKKLLGIVLVGQNELGQKLDERNPQVREVVQRIEVVTLEPLGEHLPNYLKHIFDRVKKPLTEVMDIAAIEALRQKLTGAPRRAGQPGYSVLYPLAVNNVLTAAINAAAELGVPRVTADVIREV